MNHTLNLFHIDNLQALLTLPFQEVLLQPMFCSKSGELSLNDLERCIKQLKQEEKKVVLSSDLLYHDGELDQFKKILAPLSSSLDAIRFTDPGLGEMLRESFPGIKLQFSMETNNFNPVGVEKWVEHFGTSLERVILSNQIPLSELSLFTKAFNVPVEVPGLKRLALFYSKRKLLGKIKTVQAGSRVEVQCASEDRPTQVSTVIESQNGTVMFQDRDLFILDQKEELEKKGVSYLSLCLYEKGQYLQLKRSLEHAEWENALKKNWLQNTSRGFLQGNQSHQQFKLLSNEFIAAEKQNQYGEVLESTKNSHLVIRLQRPLQLPMKVKFVTPEGRNVPCTLKAVQPLLEDREITDPTPGIYSMPWVRYVVPASILV